MSIRNRLAVDVKGRLSATVAAIALLVRRNDSLAIAAVVTIGYLVTFLWVIGDLAFRPDVPMNLVVVDEPLARMFERTGPATYEAIALFDTGVVRLLLSPINVTIGLLVAALVGVNLGLTYLATVQPAACGLEVGSGIAASIPALLSGTACCGPIILIALGVQASGLLLGLFAWLLPIGIGLLLLSVLYVAAKIDVTNVSVE